MKKVVLTSLTALGLALSAFGQGSIIVDNSAANGYLDNGALGNHYSGLFGLEVWFKTGTTGDATLNSFNGVNASAGYAALTAQGFTLATHVDPGHVGTTSAGGLVSGLGEVDIPTPWPKGGVGVVALAFWTGNSLTYMGAQHGGIYSFANPSGDPTASPPGAPATTDNWDQSIVMTPVPEPGTFALAGLGAAALLIFRRRK